MGAYTPYGQESDYYAGMDAGLTAAQTGYAAAPSAQQTPGGGFGWALPQAVVATAAAYEPGGLYSQYTAGGGFRGLAALDALEESAAPPPPTAYVAATPPPAPSPPANNGAPPVSYYDTGDTGGYAYYQQTAPTQAVSLVPYNPGGTPGPTPYAIAPPTPTQPAAPGGTPAAPPIEQITVNATPTPQQVVAPNPTFNLTPAQLSSLEQTPTLTPNGAMNPAGAGYQAPGAPSSGGGQSGGGSGGGQQPQPQPQQQQQKANPISIALEQIFGSGVQPLSTTVRPATSGMDVSGGGSTPAGGVYSAGGSPGAVNSLLAPASTNIWLPLLVGGLLLYAATR